MSMVFIDLAIHNTPYLKPLLSLAFHMDSLLAMIQSVFCSFQMIQNECTQISLF